MVWVQKNWQQHVRRLAVAFLSLCVLGTANAVIVGDVRLKSRLGQPLEGSIDIHAAPGEQIFAECFRVQGVEVPVQQRYFGDIRSGKIALSSRARVREPLLNLRLTVTCPELPKTTREFAVFLDPPKSDRPRFAERSKELEPAVNQADVKNEPVVEPSLANNSWRPTPQPSAPPKEVEASVPTPTVTSQPEVSQPTVTPMVPKQPVRTASRSFGLTLTDRLSDSSKNLIARSERNLAPSPDNPVTSPEISDPIPGQVTPAVVVNPDPAPAASETNLTVWMTVLAGLLAMTLWVVFGRSGRNLGAVTHRDAVDWLANRDNLDTVSTKTPLANKIVKEKEQPRYLEEKVDFEVQDLTATALLQEKGGHTIELDDETTKQLEESYSKELADWTADPDKPEEK